jgi:hypothetical protein
VTFKARVQKGRLVLDAPTDLPDGTEVELAVVHGDDLDDEDRVRLHAALAEAEADEASGRMYDAEDVLGELAAGRTER